MPPLSADLFDYVLPPHLIAQTPAVRRDGSRLLVVDRAAHSIAHHTFADLPRFLRAGDVLFRNNAAVLPARLFAQRPTGGRVECFLLRPVDGERVWRCLVKPGKKLPLGARFAAADSAFTGEIVGKEDDGSALVRFTTPSDETITTIASRIGEVPLPPYITREPSGPDRASNHAFDRERYQTVYADRARTVAVAAPTAGLHFTPEILNALADRGIATADVTLHVGLGTFKPITAANIEDHAIHRELYELPAATQRALFSSTARSPASRSSGATREDPASLASATAGAPARPGRRIAVGTTTVRTVEDFLATHTAPIPDERPHFAEASIFIYPPRSFRGVDALITNFHQPRSTLLCLVAAFLAPGSTDGIRWLHEIYAEAIAREYRFFSYGDAMLIT